MFEPIQNNGGTVDGCGRRRHHERMQLRCKPDRASRLGAALAAFDMHIAVGANLLPVSRPSQCQTRIGLHTGWHHARQCRRQRAFCLERRGRHPQHRVAQLRRAATSTWQPAMLASGSGRPADLDESLTNLPSWPLSVGRQGRRQSDVYELPRPRQGPFDACNSTVGPPVRRSPGKLRSRSPWGGRRNVRSNP